eukprot:6282410-Prorocentrum_lima.AAC.1
MQMLHWDDETVVPDHWSTGVPGAPRNYITGKQVKVEFFVHSLTGQRAVQPPFERLYLINPPNARQRGTEPECPFRVE